MHFVDGMDLLFAFRFNDHAVFDQEICAKPTLQLHTFASQPHSLLLNDIETLSFKFISETGLVGGLQPSGTKPAMNLDCGPDDPVRQLEHRESVGMW